MKKKLYSMLLLVCMMLNISTVYASNFEVTVTSDNLTVGNNATLSIAASDAAGKFSVVSSDSSVVSISNGSIWADNNTQSVTLTANGVGTARITITADDVTSYSGDSVTGNKIITITVKDKPIIVEEPQNNNSSNNNNNNNDYGDREVIKVKSKSSNNYLSSITIDNLSINPEFDKEILEYTIEAPANTEKINVSAQLEDSASSVTGTGEVTVTPGLNTIELEVTAENGSKKTYTLKVNVLEESPLEVTINKKKYTIIKNRKDLPTIGEYAKESDIKIGEDTVEGYYIDTLKYSLVGLKDSEGNIEYYIYKNGKYTLYKEYTFNGTTLQILDKSLDKRYKKVTFKYDDDLITSYQEVKKDIIKSTFALDNDEVIDDKYYLFYAKNLETGKEYLYQYDALEKTVQRYNLELLDMYNDNINIFYICIIVGISFIIILLTIILSKNKKIKKLNKHRDIMEFDEE